MKLELINQAFAYHFSWAADPSQINQGWCYVWAVVACELWGGTLFATDYGYHSFWFKDGKYYDSESLDGVLDWRELNIFGGRSPKYKIHERSSEELLELYHGDKTWQMIYDRVLRLI